jgi:hypothetical protein
MGSLNRAWITTLFALLILTSSAARGQASTQATPQTSAQGAPTKSAPPSGADVQEKNVQAYIDLLRRNVRQEKAEILGSMMLLSAADAAKFWPIYEEYDAQLNKLNDKRVENIKDYARNYDQMTDAKADELIQNALTYRRQRAQLLADTYLKVKQSLGAVTAARFAQIETQLLLLIDLQIYSVLPIVGQGS